MRRFADHLLVQFSVVSLVVLFTVAVVLAAVLSKKIRSDAVDNLVDEAVGTSSGRLLTAITPADLETPMTGDRYDGFHAFVQRSIVSDRTARIKIWSADGTVIYSNDPAGVGEKFPPQENLRKALRGENAVEIKIPKDPDNERERILGTLMEVYTPIVFPGADQPQDAFEHTDDGLLRAQRIGRKAWWPPERRHRDSASKTKSFSRADSRLVSDQHASEPHFGANGG